MHQTVPKERTLKGLVTQVIELSLVHLVKEILSLVNGKDTFTRLLASLQPDLLN
jgi:hypothetical protein